MTGPRPMMRMIRFVVLTWMAVGLVPGPRPCQAQAVVIGAGYATPGTIDVAPGQVITIFARVPGKIPADTVSATPPSCKNVGSKRCWLRNENKHIGVFCLEGFLRMMK